MRPEIKFCGLMRPEDAREAASLGASYLGVIFAPSPRRCTVEQAHELFDAVSARTSVPMGARASGRGDRSEPTQGAATVSPESPERVGVFAGMTEEAIASTARSLRLDVIQLHDAGRASRILALRDATGCRVWSVVHVGAHGLDAAQLAESATADAILLDAKVDGLLGGTGRTFDWEAVRSGHGHLVRTRRVILAGGLHPANVATAIARFDPDVVDVSSGVELSPGVKDHARMRAFADAVRGVSEQ